MTMNKVKKEKKMKVDDLPVIPIIRLLNWKMQIMLTNYVIQSHA